MMPASVVLEDVTNCSLIVSIGSKRRTKQTQTYWVRAIINIQHQCLLKSALLFQWVEREHYICAFDHNLCVALLRGCHKGHAIHDVFLHSLPVLLEFSKLGFHVVGEQFSEALLIAIS
jgi:hypothetical protein